MRVGPKVRANPFSNRDSLPVGGFIHYPSTGAAYLPVRLAIQGILRYPQHPICHGGTRFLILFCVVCHNVLESK